VVNVSRQRVYLVLVVFIVFMGSIGARLVTFQVLRGAALEQEARDERSGDRAVPARRGTISDARGMVLAATIPMDQLALDLTLMTPAQDSGVALGLAGPLGQRPEDILRRITDARAGGLKWLPLQRRLTPDQSAQVRALKLDCVKEDSSCVYLLPEPQRVYPNGNFAAQLLGFANWELTGVYGLEQRYNDELGGTPGRVRAEYDVAGNVIAVGQHELVPAVDGLDMTLTIDGGVQRSAEQQLDKVMREQNATGGTVIVMDVQTGAILAMVSRPSFDPNTFSTADPAVYSDPAVSALYEPGSTMKVLTMAIGLSTGAITPKSIFYDAPGYLKIDGYTIKNLYGATYGHESMTEILQHSSNLGSAWIAQQTGPDQFYTKLREFGIGTPTGVDLPGEEAGIVNWSDNPDWRPINLSTNAYGQGITVTPIQMLTAVAAVANGGKLMRPYVVKELRQGDRVIRTVEPQVVRQVVSPEVSRQVVGMMTDVVDNVSYPWVALPGYAVGSKSGTAQIPAPGGGYEPEDHTIGSLIGIGPAGNPRFAVLVKIDRPQQDPLGGHIAGPPVRDILSDLFTLYGIPPTRRAP
jgi:cell division protein FtsI (penicillin-binding protein 3)